jgi:hypothetical protein
MAPARLSGCICEIGRHGQVLGLQDDPSHSRPGRLCVGRHRPSTCESSSYHVTTSNLNRTEGIALGTCGACGRDIKLILARLDIGLEYSVPYGDR